MGYFRRRAWGGLLDRLLVGSAAGRILLGVLPFERAIELLAEADPERALTVARRWARRHPDRGMGQAFEGDILQRTGQYREALEVYRRYLLDHPDDRKRYRAVVTCALRGGLEQEARELLQAVAARHPANLEARNYLAVFHMVKGELDEAEALWQQLLAEDPRYGAARANLGIIYHFRGRFAQAILEFKLAMELDAEYGYIAQGNLGNAYYLLGRYDEARQVLEDLIERHPDYQEGRALLARILAAQDEVEEAIALLESVRKRTASGYALAVDVSFADDLALLARLYLQQGALEEAEAACRHSLALQPHTLESLILLGQICLAREKPLEAVEPLERAAALAADEPRSELIHRHLALAYYQVGRVDEATAAFRRAGTSPLASAAEEASNPEEIADRLQELYRRLDREGEQTDLLLEIGRLRIVQGRLREALDLFGRAVAQSPELAEAHYELAMACYLALENDRAVVEFTRALEKDPTLAAAHTGLGLVALSRGRPAEAAAQFRIAAALAPDDPVHHVNLAMLARWTGDREEAERLLTQVLKEHPDYRPAQLEWQRLQDAAGSGPGDGAEEGGGRS